MIKFAHGTLICALPLCFVASSLGFAAIAAAPSAVYAQTETETILHSFGSVPNDALGSQSALIQGSDGNFYGTTWLGGYSGTGTVYKVTPSGQVTVLHSFRDPSVPNDGDGPGAALVQGLDGNFYGTTTWGGGTANAGTVFKITPSGKVTILHCFGDGSVRNDGNIPSASLIQTADGTFYGTTQAGGSAGRGTVFKMTLSGQVTILHSFYDGSVPNDGISPRAALVQAEDGNFYGTTADGGSTVTAAELGLGNFYGYGTAFMMTPSGQVTILHSFGDGSVLNDAEEPGLANLIKDEGNLYGTTPSGGSAGKGAAFELTPSGQVTILHSFGDGSVSSDGTGPNAIILGADGYFYGTTTAGGGTSADTGGAGTAFEMTTSGQVTILHSFQDGSVPNDGLQPVALVQGTDGNFYGTTYEGGGTVFTLTPFTLTSLSPSSSFVSTQPKITVTGTKFVSGCSVLVDGTSYSAKYVSPTSVTFTMPSSKLEKTHVLSIQVQNPGGSTSDAVPFTVYDTPPTTMASIADPEGSGGYAGKATITLTAVAGTAAVIDTYYSLDGAANRIYTAPLNVTAIGSHTLTFYSVDALGAQEATNTVNFSVSALVLYSLSPDSAPVGPQPKITVTGAGFLPGDGVVVDGTGYSTKYDNSTTLTFTMPSSKMSKAHVLSVEVENPSTGDTSNALPFTVTATP